SEEMNCAFVNLHPFFTDGKGALRKELTNDHLHLLGEGYRIWAEEIRKIVMGG
ncbi:MAG: platelet activating factor, partial [Anaerolinea sp.]|nr:platelet activating factor [Anaerolinea sp.]